MLKFEKISDDGNVATYAYHPGGSGAPGTATYDRASSKATLVEKSPDEDGMSAGQMMACLRRMASTGDFKQSGTVAWY